MVLDRSALTGERVMSPEEGDYWCCSGNPDCWRAVYEHQAPGKSGTDQHTRAQAKERPRREDIHPSFTILSQTSVHVTFDIVTLP